MIRVDSGHLANSVQFYRRNNFLNNTFLKAVDKIEEEFKQERRNNEQKKLKTENYLVFCNTKLNAQNNCKNFVEKLKKNQVTLIRNQCEELTRAQVQIMIEQIKNEVLKQAILNRVAFHHSQLEKNQKNIVIELYKKKWITFLFSTTTLAQGVNLPVKAVIILMLAVHFTQQQGQIRMKTSTIDQMVGRAGRSHNDGQGYFCLIDKPDLVDPHQHYFRCRSKFQLQNIKSGLSKKINFIEFIFFEMCFRSQSNLNQTCQQTLYAVQLKQNASQQFFDVRIRESKAYLNQIELDKKVFQYATYYDNFLSVRAYANIYHNFKRLPATNQCSHIDFIANMLKVKDFLKLSYVRTNQIFKQKFGIKKDSLPLACKLEKRKITKAFYYLQILLLGKFDKIQRGSETYMQLVDFDNLFRRLCQLLKTILLNSQIYKEYNYVRPGSLFYCLIYCKYSNLAKDDIFEWQSHMNIRKCLQSIGIKNEQIIQRLERCRTQDNGFFNLRQRLQDQSRLISNIIVRQKQQILTKIGSFKFIQHRLQNGRYKIQPKDSQQQYELHWFVLKDQQYIYEARMDQDTQWDKQSKDIFVVLAVYKRVIGMDQIIYLKNETISYIEIENASSLRLPEQKYKSRSDQPNTETDKILNEESSDQFQSSDQQQQQQQQQQKLNYQRVCNNESSILQNNSMMSSFDNGSSQRMGFGFQNRRQMRGRSGGKREYRGRGKGRE